jgi:hypothetical protein
MMTEGVRTMTVGLAAELYQVVNGTIEGMSDCHKTVLKHHRPVQA